MVSREQFIYFLSVMSPIWARASERNGIYLEDSSNGLSSDSLVTSGYFKVKKTLLDRALLQRMLFNMVYLVDS